MPAPSIPSRPEVYEATIRFGVATDTDDCTGLPLRTAPLPAMRALGDAIRRLTGVIQQRPPAYSAKHVDGVRAYALARRGEEPQLKTVAVTVNSWDVCARRDDEIDVRISCGTGTYIRALARDLGELLHSAAHLTSLRRVSAGPFSVGDANSWNAVLAGEIDARPLVDALPHWRRHQLTPDDYTRVVRGMRIDATDATDDTDAIDITGARTMLLDDHGTLVAIAHRVDASWQPDAVLRDV